MDQLPVPHAPTPRGGWLTPHDPEWARAWSVFPDPVLEHPESGEVLQYMGSTTDPECGGWVHVFRHRQVPTSQQRQYWHIGATPGWAPAPHRQTREDTL